MKPKEISNALNQIGKAMERETAYCETNAKAKFTPKVAIAMARNRKVLEQELSAVIGIEEKNKKIAEQKGVALESLEEQKEFMNTEIDVCLTMVSEEDIGGCNDLLSADYYALLFMKEETDSNGGKP